MGLSKERGLYFQEKWEEMEYRFANIEMKKEIERLNNIINELRLNNFSAKILLDYITNLQTKLQQKENIIKEVREYLKFLKEHYEELRTSPVEDSYFINDMLRQMFIKQIECYLIGIEDILDKEKI